MSERARKWGQRLRARRELCGLSQVQLAEAVGVGQAAVSKWEKGYASPRHDLLPVIARVLGADVDDLFPRLVA